MTSKKKTAGIILLIILLVLIAAGGVYSHFGGFGTGESADPEEFAKYAAPVSELTVPEGTRIIGLGEATHGNREFQTLKLDVFKVLVEQYGVRAFAIEGDYGGCEAVNRYIHGGEGSAAEAAAAIGFTIYRTEEMEDLISWMRSYNETAEEGEDLRFFGFDMQRMEYNYRYLLETAKAAGLDTSDLENLWDGDGWAADVSREETAAVLTDLRENFLGMTTDNAGEERAALGAHLADILLQNNEMAKVYEENAGNYNGVRDGYMAENTMWILGQEEKRGNDRIFITGHNGHLEQYGTYVGGEQKVMGNLLADEIGEEAYFMIGTEFYKTECNCATNSEKRVIRTFYSRDPLAKAARKNGENICYLDFSGIPAESDLTKQVNDYIFMGSLGENPMDGLSGLVFRVLPHAYRVWQIPSQLYDGMIFVTEAHPTQIK